MRLLLDTHALLWWSRADPRLSDRAARLIADPDSEIFVSAATTWESAPKRLGKLFGAEDMTGDFGAFLAARRFAPLPITIAHAQLAGNLKGAHKDPFDRMLAAQAMIEDLPLLTDDPGFANLA